MDTMSGPHGDVTQQGQTGCDAWALKWSRVATWPPRVSQTSCRTPGATKANNVPGDTSNISVTKKQGTVRPPGGGRMTSTWSLGPVR